MLIKLAKFDSLQFELAANRLISLLISVITIPYILRNCGTEDYGLYVMLCSISFFLNIADFGMSNGLVSQFVSTRAETNQEKMNSILINIILFGGLLVLILPPTLLLLMDLIDWARFFQINSSSTDSTTLLIVVLIGASMNLIGSIGLKVLLANQLNRIYSRVQLFIVLITNIGLMIGSSSQNPLKGMLFSSLVLPNLIGILCLILLISFDNTIVLSIDRVSFDVIKDLISSGKFFVVLQIATIVNYQIDSLLIAHFLGKSELAEYNVVLRMGSVPFILVSAAVLPIWAATANLYAKGKGQEALDGVCRAAVKVLLFSSASMVLFILFGSRLIKIWTLQQIQPSVELVFANALWIPLSCLMQLFAMYLNGAKAYRFLLISTILFSVFNFLVAVLFLKFYSNISGPMWSNSISSLLFFIVPTLVFIKYKSNKERGSFSGTTKN